MSEQRRRGWCLCTGELCVKTCVRSGEAPRMSAVSTRDFPDNLFFLLILVAELMLRLPEWALGVSGRLECRCKGVRVGVFLLESTSVGGLK